MLSDWSKSGSCLVFALQQGVLIALDKSAPKVERIQRNCQRLNVSCVRAFAFDSTHAVRRFAECDDSTSGRLHRCLAISSVEVVMLEV